MAHGHSGHEHRAPHGIWPSQSPTEPGPRGIVTERGASGVADPAIVSWKLNTTAETGTSSDAEIDSYVRDIAADVLVVAYDDPHVYVQATGVPSHPVGPFVDGNPSYPSDVDGTYRIARMPTVQVGDRSATGLGPIGIMVNGVPFFDARDGHSFEDEGVWNQNAVVVRASGFDAARGHPAPIGQVQPPMLVPGSYHYHQAAVSLLEQLDPGNTGKRHSPLIGFAFDSFPVYGPYGYSNPNDGTSAIKQLVSSYRARSELETTGRTSLPEGEMLPESLHGPVVGKEFPLGYYIEDFVYAEGSGDLNAFNGRFAATPEYPDGTFAYYLTLDAIESIVSETPSTYPDIVGPDYYGVVDTANTRPGAMIQIPDDVTYYLPEPAYEAGLMAAVLTLVCSRYSSTRQSNLGEHPKAAIGERLKSGHSARSRPGH